jgi:ABC transporter DrrB family efflux protein
MTAATTTITSASTGSAGPRGLGRNALLLTGRHLTETSRTPDVLIYTVVVPVVLMLLLNYAFGGAIAPGGQYIQDLVPAIFVLAASEIGFTTAAGTATDLTTGLLDRFRSLPIARIALPLGRSISDTIRHVLAIAVITGVGYALGYRFDTVPGALAAVGVALAYGFALTWLAVCLGAAVANAETAASASLLLMLPPLLASSALVPVATMPGWLQAIANNNPHTAAVDAMRALASGGPAATDLWHIAAWTAGLLAFAIPLATYLHRRAT